jgi:hypothetical protein
MHGQGFFIIPMGMNQPGHQIVRWVFAAFLENFCQEVLRFQLNFQGGSHLLFIHGHAGSRQHGISPLLERLDVLAVQPQLLGNDDAWHGHGKIVDEVAAALVDEIVDKLVGHPVNVRGVQLGDEEALFDVVVDASGRTTKFPAWLKDRGADIAVEDEEAEMVYYTRHYKLNPGMEEPDPNSGKRQAGDLGYVKYGIFPGDNGHFATIMCAHPDEVMLRKAFNDEDAFHEMLMAIPGTADWVDPARSTPTTDSFGFADIRTTWRHYVHEAEDGTKTPVALNFFAVGDATLRTNPLYGRGCAIGMHHAQIMAQVLEDEADPAKRAILLDERTEDELRPIFDASQNEDRNAIKRARAIMAGKSVEKPDGLKAWFGLAFADAIAAAAQNELHVVRGTLRTFQLEEKPGAFLKDKKIRNTIYKYMLRGRKKNASASIVEGPTRDEMLSIIEGALGEVKAAAE